MKKIFIGVSVLLILVACGFGYVKYKQYNVENTVVNYLKTEEGIPEDKINTEPFIANMPGNKNWMVKVEIKGDSKVYSYYKNKDGKVVLDSYIEDGEVTIVDKVMN
ncbi:hypothetical protein ACIQ4I_08165 [Rummeliibacillus sp. NPDC094406]|uniref:hypothetical protein n=1 Tax=Rummeliibacillus sp. NPDC094406 TaxID=3364511 RepID=UPI0038145019